MEGDTEDHQEETLAESFEDNQQNWQEAVTAPEIRPHTVIADQLHQEAINAPEIRPNSVIADLADLAEVHPDSGIFEQTVQNFTKSEVFEIIKNQMEPETIQQLESRTFKISDSNSNQLFKIFHKFHPIAQPSDLLVIHPRMIPASRKTQRKKQRNGHVTSDEIYNEKSIKKIEKLLIDEEKKVTRDLKEEYSKIYQAHTVVLKNLKKLKQDEKKSQNVRTLSLVKFTPEMQLLQSQIDSHLKKMDNMEKLELR